jgi:hypothetical protein
VLARDGAGGLARAYDAQEGRDATLLRWGTAAAVLGLVVQVAMEVLHPSGAQPNHSAAAFREYASSQLWTQVHVGQFFGTLLLVVAFVALSRALATQPGVAGAVAVVAGVTATLVAAVFAVQMAVDGVALKGAIEAWLNAAGTADEAAAFRVADGIRWLEKGLAGFFQLLTGTTLLALGLSIALGNRFPRWLGWTGAAAGVGSLAGGTVTTLTGFSPEASMTLLPGTLLSLVFLLGACASVWRRGPSTAD